MAAMRTCVAVRQRYRNRRTGEEPHAALTIASNTGCTSVVELAMTLRYSLIVVCLRALP